MEGKDDIEARQADLQLLISEIEEGNQDFVFRDLIGGGFLIGTLGIDHTLGTDDDYFEYWPIDRPAYPDAE